MEASATLFSFNPVPTSGSGIPILSHGEYYTQPQPNIHGAIYGFCVVSLFLATVTTCMRLFTKFHVFKVRRWDDYLMIASWCGLVCMWSFILVSIRYGAGDHIQDITFSEVPGFKKYAFLHELFYAIIQCLLKTSICLQILHIFVPNLSWRGCYRDWRFWSIISFIVLQVSWFMIFFWVSLFQCHPVEKEFDPNIPGTCIPGWNQYNVVVSAWNMVSDTFMLAFPFVCIWNLNMSTAFKVEAGTVFFAGTLAVASSLLRLIFTIRSLRTQDLTLVLTQIALCDTGEITAGMVTGNFVPLPRFVIYMSEIVTALIKGEPVRHKGFDDTNNDDPETAERNASTVSGQELSFEELMNASRMPGPNS